MREVNEAGVGSRERESHAGAAGVGARLKGQISSNSALRYLFTGAGLFFLDLGVYALLHLGFGVSIMSAQLVARSVGATVGFVAHKFISFGGNGDKQSVSAGSQGVAYGVVMGANILISPFLVALMVTLVGGHAIAGKLISDAIIIAETYLLLRVIFRPEPEPKASLP